MFKFPGQPFLSGSNGVFSLWSGCTKRKVQFSSPSKCLHDDALKFAEGTTHAQRRYSPKDRAYSAIVLGMEENNCSRRSKWGRRSVLVGRWTRYLGTK